MLLILIGILVHGGAVAGFGTALLAWIDPGKVLRRGLGPAIWPVTGWLGFLAIAIAGMAVNFFVPLGPHYRMGITIAGWGLLLLMTRRGAVLPTPRAWGIFTAGALALLLSGLAWSPPYNFDDGFYHLQAVKWVQESPLPRGLANLLPQFGFNSAWHIVAATLAPRRDGFASVFILHPLLLFFQGMGVCGAARELARGGRAKLSSVFLLLTAIPLLMRGGYTIDLMSVSNDLPAAAGVLNGLAVLILAYEGQPSADDAAAGTTGGWRLRGLLLAVVVAAFALTVKLSTAPLLLACSIAALVEVARSRGAGALVPMILRFALPALMAGGLWTARGYWLTGYPCFPSVAFALGDPAWRMPLQRAMAEKLWVESWGRQPGLDPMEVLQGWRWVGPWLDSLVQFPVQLIELSLIAFLATYPVLTFGFRARSAPALSRPEFVVPFCAAIAGIVFWFLSAPDPRFGFGFIYGAVILIAAHGIEGAFWTEDSRKSAPLWLGPLVALLGGVFVFASIHFLGTGAKLAGLHEPMIPSVESRALLRPLRWPRIVEAELAPHPIGDGRVVFMPKLGQCWLAPQPCSSKVIDGLTARRDDRGRWVEFSMERGSGETGRQ